MAGTSLCACFENESEVGAGRETPWCDISYKESCRFIILLLSIRILCLKTILVNAKGSDLNSRSENVWFSCLKSSYCIQKAKSGWGGGM